jgi:Sigma-70, region 4/Bacterial RNA polymerase, alpha chain C terminal domain
MTTSLRAYLMLRSDDGGWSVSVHKSIEEVLDAWRTRPYPDECTGVLHVGFDRPASPLFEGIARLHPARMLVTGSARYALPKGFESSRRAVGDVEGLPVFVATRGWGYLQKDDVPEQLPISETPSLASEPQGWVKEFVRQHPNRAAELRSAGIHDEISYLDRENRLEREPRFQAGLFRYRSLVKASAFDPCEIVRAGPPWLLDRGFATIDLSVRISNAFVKVNVTCARDLVPFDSDSLLRLPNFGRKSLRDLYDALLAALNEGPFDIERKIAQSSLDTLIADVERSLTGLDKRERDILLARMGLRRAAETLQEIGDRYNVTRERIRQIESKTIDKMSKTAFWSDLLSTKLEALLLGREFPLPVLGLEAVDAWFVGIGRSSSALRFILANFCGGRFGVSEIGDIDYVGRITDEEWSHTEREARRLLATGGDQEWSEVHCRTLVNSLLDESRREFRPLLWQSASALCHFVDVAGGDRMLASYGRGADQVVEAVLMDSTKPLHYSEIAERAKERSGRDIDVRRAHNAAASIGILMGRGLYGLEHHLKLTKDMQSDLLDRLEEIVLEGPDDRQWHASELLSRVADSNVPYVEVLDKYVIDYVLGASSAVRRLGRMAWAKTGSSMSARIDVRQAIAALLQNAGGPLTTNEIRQRLVAIRGVGDHFQISSSNMIVRLPGQQWGLNDRDVPLKRAFQAAFYDRLETVLNARGNGIHITEIDQIVRSEIADVPEMPPETIFSLAANDHRLKVTSGEYLFLTEWGAARRKTLMEALIDTLRGRDGPTSLDRIVGEVEARTERRCDKSAVVSCLRSAEATIDPLAGGWVLRSDTAQVDMDEPDMAPTARLLPAIDFSSRVAGE